MVRLKVNLPSHFPGPSNYPATLGPKVGDLNIHGGSTTIIKKEVRNSRYSILKLIDLWFYIFNRSVKKIDN
jgi:hypothetical protein